MFSLPKRFSLRNLLLAIVLFMAAVGYFSNTIRTYLTEQDSLRALAATDKFDPVYPDGSYVPGLMANSDC